MKSLRSMLFLKVNSFLSLNGSHHFFRWGPEHSWIQLLTLQFCRDRGFIYLFILHSCLKTEKQKRLDRGPLTQSLFLTSSESWARSPNLFCYPTSFHKGCSGRLLINSGGEHSVMFSCGHIFSSHYINCTMCASHQPALVLPWSGNSILFPALGWVAVTKIDSLLPTQLREETWFHCFLWGQVWHEGVNGILFRGQGGLGFRSSSISLTMYAEHWVRKVYSRTWWSWQQNLQWCRRMPDTSLRVSSICSFQSIIMEGKLGQGDSESPHKSQTGLSLGSLSCVLYCPHLSPGGSVPCPPPPSSWSFPTFAPYFPSSPPSSIPLYYFLLSSSPFPLPNPLSFPSPNLMDPTLTPHLLCSRDSLEMLNHRHLSSHPASTVGDRVQDFVHSRQTLCNLSYILSPCCFLSTGEIVLW